MKNLLYLMLMMMIIPLGCCPDSCCEDEIMFNGNYLTGKVEIYQERASDFNTGVISFIDGGQAIKGSLSCPKNYFSSKSHGEFVYCKIKKNDRSIYIYEIYNGDNPPPPSQITAVDNNFHQHPGVFSLHSLYMHTKDGDHTPFHKFKKNPTQTLNCTGLVEGTLWINGAQRTNPPKAYLEAELVNYYSIDQEEKTYYPLTETIDCFGNNISKIVEISLSHDHPGH